jgi:phosphate-selective porin OprO/OprP
MSESCRGRQFRPGRVGAALLILAAFVVASRAVAQENPPRVPFASLRPQGQAAPPAKDAPSKPAEPAQKPADPPKWEVGKDLNFKMSWAHGLTAQTEDKAFRVHVGGRTQFDTIWMSAGERVRFGPGGTGDIRDGVNFRRARLTVEGTIFEQVDFWFEYDFLNTFNAERTGDPLVANTPVPTDVFVIFTKIPVLGNIKVGNHKPPLCFERLTSSRFLNFLERSLTTDAFINGLDNGFRPGIQVYHWAFDERLTWAVGVFKNNTSVFGWNVGDGEYDVTGRFTALPWYEHDGRCLLHLGLGASHRDTDDDQIRYRARTLLRNGPGTLHTVLAEVRALAGNETLLVPELVLVLGPFTLQTEYFATWSSSTRFPINPPAARVDRGTAFFQGYYVEALYFLTGEHRVYDRRYPRFDRVVPHEGFFFVDDECGNWLCGKGAWQVAARYSWIDLSDSGIRGGEVHDLTLGLNWFLNPNMKVQWNYTIARRNLDSGSDGTVQGFGMRLAMDF